MERGGGGGHSLISGIRGCATQQYLVFRVQTPEVGILLGLRLQPLASFCHRNSETESSISLFYPSLMFLTSKFAISAVDLGKLV